MWKLREECADGTRAEAAALIKARLEALPALVDGLISAEVGVNFTESDMAYDLCLYSTLESRAALDAYQIHPAHLAVKEIVHRNVRERAVCDYEL